MVLRGCSFDDALKEAQELGYAESDPTLDINGMDSAHKLAILVYLALGKYIPVTNIYTEGITRISHEDIQYADDLGLCIKLLAIAKNTNNAIEARVHPTLIAKDHPLASINGIYNALYIDAEPQGNLLLSGEGAGQMAAASGVFSDLINLVSSHKESRPLSNLHREAKNLRVKKIDQVETKFYIRLNVKDKPGSLSTITGVLGRHGISINSVTQKAHNKTQFVPVVLLTDYTSEKKMKQSLVQIQRMSMIKSKPVAIRQEKLW